tara:strand:- start:2054 stop:3340 length:1287 start_codon:yes stop_codon:yes gene_type:complete
MPNDSSKDKFFYDQFLKNPDKSLLRIYDILLKLGSPQKSLTNVIHIAGTNGKGSTLAFLQSCLIKSGYSVNAFISPHLKLLNERIVINNNTVNDETLEAIIKECMKTLDNEKISFFEFITACAYKLFAKNLSDWHLIEVGMGGSHDATNTLPNKDLSIITPISLDHENFLGNTLKKIAKEKLGIINQGSQVIFGPQDNYLKDIILEHLSLTNSKGFFYKDDWDIKKINNLIVYEDSDSRLEINSIGLKGDHQIKNAGLSIASLKCLERDGKINISDEQIKQGLKEVYWPGRFSMLSGKLTNIVNDSCDIWVDGCHNPAGSKVIAKEILSMNKTDGKEVVIVLGLLKKRNIENFIQNFLDISKEIIVVPIKDRQSIDESEVKIITKKMNYSTSSKGSITQALSSLKGRENLRILICGSLYLAAEAISLD